VYTADFAASLNQSGQLSWTNLSQHTVEYQVEWAATMEGPWTNDWADLQGIPATQDDYCVSVPMFYRVRAIVTNEDFYASDYGAPNATTINQCLSDIGQDTAILILDDSNWDIDANVTIPTNVTLQVEPGRIVYIYSSYALNINSEFDAPMTQIFDTHAISQSDTNWRSRCRVRFSNLKYDWVYPEWFGADPTDNSPDTLAVNFAADAYPRVYFNTGTWLFNNTLLLTNDNVYLKGAGMGNTTIQYDDDILDYDGHGAPNVTSQEITSRLFLVTSQYRDANGYKMAEGVDNAVIEDLTFDCSFKKLQDAGFSNITPQSCIIRGDGPRASQIEIKNFGCYEGEGFTLIMAPWCGKDTNTIIIEDCLIHTAQYPEVWHNPALVTVLDARGTIGSHSVNHLWEYSTLATQVCDVIIRNNIFRDIDLYDETNDIKAATAKLCDGATLYENNLITNCPMVTAFGGFDTGMYEDPIVIRSNRVYGGCYNAAGALRDDFGLRAWGGFIIEDNYFEVSPPHTTKELRCIAFYLSGSWPQQEVTNRPSIWGDLIIRNNTFNNLSTNNNLCWGTSIIGTTNVSDLYTDDRTWFSGLELTNNNLINCQLYIKNAPCLFNSNAVISDNACFINEHGCFSNFFEYSTGVVLPFPQPIENSDWYESPVSNSCYRATTNNTFPYNWGYSQSSSEGGGYPITRLFYESVNEPGTNNLMSDPSMEGTGTCGWSRQALEGTYGINLSTSTNYVYHGSQSLKVTMLQDYQMYLDNPSYLLSVTKSYDGSIHLSNAVIGCYIYPTTTNLVCMMSAVPRYEGSSLWGDMHYSISPRYVLQTGKWNHVQMQSSLWQSLKNVNPLGPWDELPNGMRVSINIKNDQIHPVHSNDVIYIDNVYIKTGTDLSPIICSD
jgi:hypothetical protein